MSSNRTSKLARLVMLLVGLGGLSISAVPQTAGPPVTRGRGMVVGKVVDGGTGRAIPGAFVTIAAAGRPIGQPTMVADTQGRFVFRDLPAGTFDLKATARGYLADDIHSESGMPAQVMTIELADGQQLTDVVIRLIKPARISGAIVDDAGDPVEGAQLGVLRVEYIAGHRRLRLVAGGDSDDRGTYTSGRLTPGSYVVGLFTRRMTIPVSTRELVDRLAGAPGKEQQDFISRTSGWNAIEATANGFRVGDFIFQPGLGGASLGPAPFADGTLLGTPALFYPGVASAEQATPITLKAGDVRSGVNLQVRLVPTVRVSGRVMGPDGPVAHLALRLMPAGSDTLVAEYPFEQGITMTTESGAFTFLGVASGSYTVKAEKLPRSPRPSASDSPPALSDERAFSGSLPVQVEQTDVTDLALTLRRGPSVQGLITFAGASPAPSGAALARGALRFELADGRAPDSFTSPPPRAPMDTEGRFRSIGLPIGRYVLRIDGYPGWTLESAMWRGRDISDEGLDTETGDDMTGVVVTLTDTPARVTGIVRTSAGAGAADATVLLFSPTSAHWIDRGSTPRRQLQAITSKTGTFSLSGMPPGEYLVLALAGNPPEDWRMPEFLNGAARTATRITVESRTARAVNLTIGSAPRGGSR